MSLKSKILSILFLSIGVLMLTNIIEQYTKYQESLTFFKKNLADNLNHSLETNLTQQFHYLSLSLESMLLDQEVVRLFAERDREGLAEKLHDYHRSLQTEYDIAQFQFHYPDARSFLRLHRVSKFDDDLSSFRRTVVAANKTQRPIKSLEVGRAELGTRVVYPVYYQDKHIGSVEFGGSAMGVVRQLKQIFGVEYAVGIKQSVFAKAKRFEPGDSDILIGDVVFHAFSSSNATQLVWQYQENRDEYTIGNQLYTTFRLPLHDFSQQNIGYILVISNLQEIQNAALWNLVRGLLISTLIALLSFIAIWWVMHTAVSRPLDKAMRVANTIAEGDLNVSLEIQGRDEISRLLQTIDAVLMQQLKNIIFTTRATLQQLAEGDFSARIQGEFNGDFAAIKHAINNMAERLQQLIHENSNALQHLAEGDMRARIEGDFPGEFAEIKRAVNRSAETLQALLYDTNVTFAQLANGQLAARIDGEFPGDFSDIQRATNAMASDLQALIGETRTTLAQLAKGDMDIRLTLRYAGDFSEIKRALEVTAQKLAAATSENQRQSWLKTGQTQLAEQISGEKDLPTLAADIINFLTAYIGAHIGAFYLWEEVATSSDAALLEDTVIQTSNQLRMVASHAYKFRKDGQHVFQLGEGLVGQAALENKTFIVQQPPADYVPLQSGLGSCAVQAILVAPFHYEQRVKGVVELATLHHFDAMRLDFLEQVLPSIGIAINVAQARMRMQALLQQTQQQAQALKTQQLELQSNNEELQAQQEELQVQQEELRQTNEELELRTQETERQSRVLLDKNQALEQAQTALQTKAQELERASTYKSEFLANMSHELRTPLNSILILAQLLGENTSGNMDEKQVEYLRTIYHAGNDLLSLINDVLDLSKVEAGKIELLPEQVVIDDMLQALARKFSPLAEQKGLQFILDIAPDVPTSIESDMQRLKQIISNLLSNAIKFTEQGSVTLRAARPATDDPQASNKLAISVSDTGIGIPAEKHALVFEAFQQADGTTQRRFGGTGLGLSISRQFVELLGGEISLHSEAGQGSTFTLTVYEKLPDHVPIFLPDNTCMSCTVEAMDEAMLSMSESEITESNAETTQAATTFVDDRDNLQDNDKILLVIEDDNDFAQLLYSLAQEKLFRCIIADEGSTGLQYATDYQPNAIILDLALPQIDGWAIMKQLKTNLRTRHIPVHFISGIDHSHDAKQMGVIGYSLKPVSMGDLHKTFNNINYIITKSDKYVLLIVDDVDTETHLRAWIGGTSLHLQVAQNLAQAQQYLAEHAMDCIVVDLNISQGGLQLLEQLHEQRDLSGIPLIVYGERPLSDTEETLLHTYNVQWAVKAIHSPEHALEEVTLFLQQINTQLSSTQQNMLQRLRDRENVLLGKKILLVDDDARNAMALSASLQDKGMQIIVAENGIQALEQLNAHPDVALVLMDMMMPEMDGYQAMRTIREQPDLQQLPIIALTAKAMKGDKAKCIEAGANDYLAKPIDTDKLVALLRVWLYQ